jgi:8-oxo-dGTP pyrophosphatase MutT (NUDIX family)
VSDTQVRAAGAVVWRTAPTGGRVEVLVVHRPRYDDWSLPKGKLDPGESWEDGARREVAEETGYTGDLGAQVAVVHYTDHLERPKEVRYFDLRDPVGRFEPNDEVDEALWLEVDAACRKVTRRMDADVIRSWVEAVR